jgi:hypothetical protein
MRHSRRTCPRLWGNNGRDVEQIKFLLGRSSIQTTIQTTEPDNRARQPSQTTIQTTEPYLGSEQDIGIAVNDNLGL